MIKINMKIKIGPDGKASLAFPQIKGIDLSQSVDDLPTDQTRALVLLTAIKKLTESFNQGEVSNEQSVQASSAGI
jgi:hypothetical protein